MTETLAEALSDIKNPETIHQILTADSTNIEQNSPALDSTDQPNLTDLYDRFLTRRQDRSPSTRSQYKRTILHFIEFAKDKEVARPSEISTELVDSYIDQLQGNYDADATIHTYTKNVRSWLQWLNNRNLCDESVYRILDKEEIGLSPSARDEAIPAVRANQLLQHLRTKKQGTKIHALPELLWNAGPRIGGIHSADLKDFDPESRELRFRHRPEMGTRLKNGDRTDGTSGDGERNVELSNHVVEALQLYIETIRPDVTDKHGREPLFATQYGRASRSTLRRWVYRATSCRWLSVETEDQACDGSCCPDSDVCPHSYYPHAIRRGAIVHHLSGGLRPDLASERFDVSTKIIRKHYDPRTKRQRKEDRAESVRNAWDAD
ncbi:tyrosine-type recombinase/integrase [Haloarcula sp. KBTZ06]|uniref:tyrosine-type recombinase/integrase n=1 Tax=Haloarcula sp. KBTZ06 TaxID=3402682 RepID=UPI003B42C8A5